MILMRMDFRLFDLKWHDILIGADGTRSGNFESSPNVESIVHQTPFQKLKTFGKVVPQSG